MIVKRLRKNGVNVLFARKDLTDTQINSLLGSALTRKQISTIIDTDTDVYDADTGALLLVFRKSVLDPEKIERFYQAVKPLLRKQSSYRTNCSKTKTKVTSNIFGYYDRFANNQNALFRDMGWRPNIHVRETSFNMRFPERFQETIPLIQEIDHGYAYYTPDYYDRQLREARKTPFRIDDTSMTTITLNMNFQTHLHRDSGDFSTGFGNLVVIEKGSPYQGAETCFPQYKLGVNVRTADLLLMDVHQPHANLPMVAADCTSTRISVVCYLREDIVKWSQGITIKQRDAHLAQLRKVLLGPKE